MCVLEKQCVKCGFVMCLEVFVVRAEELYFFFLYRTTCFLLSSYTEKKKKLSSIAFETV